MFGRPENSIRQAGKILRREFPPSRLFEIEIDDLLAENISSRRKIWAVYVADEDDSLVPRKIYEIEIYGELPQVLVQDDDGEAFMCPREWFVPITVPTILSERLGGSCVNISGVRFVRQVRLLSGGSSKNDRLQRYI